MNSYKFPSNNQKAKVVNYIYRRLAASQLGKNIHIERDPLHHRYDVNKFSLQIRVNKQKNKYSTLCKEFENMIVEGLSLEKFNEENGDIESCEYLKTNKNVILHFSVAKQLDGDNYISVFVN